MGYVQRFKALKFKTLTNCMIIFWFSYSNKVLGFKLISYLRRRSGKMDQNKFFFHSIEQDHYGWDRYIGERKKRESEGEWKRENEREM